MSSLLPSALETPRPAPRGVARETKGRRTREAILAKAVEQACVVGVRGLTLGELATDLGLSKSGLYAHFGSKEALQLAVLDQAGERFAEQVIVPALAVPRGERRLRDLADRWIATCLVREPNGCLFVKASIDLDEEPGPVRDFLRVQHFRFQDSLCRVVRGGITAAEFRPDLDVERFGQDWYGLMLGFYHAHRLLADPRAEERARAALDALIDAARVPQGVPS